MAVSWYQLYVGLEPRKGERPTGLFFFFLAHISSILLQSHMERQARTL